MEVLEYYNFRLCAINLQNTNAIIVDISQLFLLQQEVANNEKQRETENKKEQVNVQDTRNETPPNNGNVPRNINENDAVPVKQPPKIHFDDGVGAISPEDDKKDENNDNIMEVVESNPGDKEQIEEANDERELLDDPESRKLAQLPNVDPSKIKVEKKDMFGRPLILRNQNSCICVVFHCAQRFILS